MDVVHAGMQMLFVHDSAETQFDDAVHIKYLTKAAVIIRHGKWNAFLLRCNRHKGIANTCASLHTPCCSAVTLLMYKMLLNAQGHSSKG